MKSPYIYILLSVLLQFGYLNAQHKTYPSRFVVAQDGSGDFRTIQEAVNAVRDHSVEKVLIYIKKGIYQEKLVVPANKRNIAMVGESAVETIITNGDYSGKDRECLDLTGNSKFTTYTSYTILVSGDDFSAENLTIINSAGPVGQAVALHVEADRAAFHNCKIQGHQDTLYLSKAGTRNYFSACQIEGTTDFIFGAASAFFEECTIISLKNSYITAASTTDLDEYGFVFQNCKLVPGNNDVNKVYLGRPWRPYAKTVFIDTEMGTHIRKEGWDNWRDPSNERTVFYAEYNSFGPGGGEQVKERVAWGRQLKKKNVSKYGVDKVLADWIPRFQNTLL